MIDVPVLFRVADRSKYPNGNWPDFEYWFMIEQINRPIETDREYLPILFTAYFKNHNYGKDKWSIDELQQFVDTLPADKKYFCVVQYDDGTIIDWGGRDVKVFAMSGKPKGSIPIPLVCQPHRFSFQTEKDVFMSFVGRVTDPIRQDVLEWFTQHPTAIQCYVSTKAHSIEEYCRIMARSKYVICPRGYGASSFRIAEALQYGAIPIILNRWGDSIFWDDVSFQLSYEEGEHPKDLLTQMFMSLSRGKYPIDPEKVSDVYQKQYTFEGVREIIKKCLDDDSHNTRSQAERSNGTVTTGGGEA